jgi:hypothetical protein
MSVEHPDPTPEPDPIGVLPGESVVVGAEPTFIEELQHLINRYSVENAGDTPDFILAEFIQNVLIDYAKAVKARDRWYGEEKP